MGRLKLLDPQKRLDLAACALQSIPVQRRQAPAPTEPPRDGSQEAASGHIANTLRRPLKRRLQLR